MRINALTAAALAGAVFLASVLPSAAADRRVTIVNNTGFTMMEFYGSNNGTDSWEEDILGKDVLPSGMEVAVNFDGATGYCMFDFKAVFDDGDEVAETGVNVCEIGRFTFN